MKCWNCLREAPRGAKVCPHCETLLAEEPSAEEIAEALEALKQIAPDDLAELRSIALESESAEDFANQILVGDCPKCGGTKTGDCDNDPEIENILVGRCYECGQFWCTDCGRLLDRSALECPCWDEEVDDEVP
jgi:hypothetical protein